MIAGNAVGAPHERQALEPLHDLARPVGPALLGESEATLEQVPP